MSGAKSYMYLADNYDHMWRHKQVIRLWRRRRRKLICSRVKNKMLLVMPSGTGQNCELHEQLRVNFSRSQIQLLALVNNDQMALYDNWQ